MKDWIDDLVGWWRQYFAVRRAIRGYKKVIRECRKINRQLDKMGYIEK